MLTGYLEMLRGSLAPPQGWDTNTVRWGENLRKENSKGWRWVENSGDRMPRFEGFEGFKLGSKRRWVTPLNILFWNWCTLLPNYDFEHLLLFLCGLSSIKILESLLPYVLCTQDMNQRNPAVSAFTTSSDCVSLSIGKIHGIYTIIQQSHIWGNFSTEN